MRRSVMVMAVVPLLLAFSASSAFAFGCPASFKEAEDAIDSAAAAMAKLPKEKQGLVHTLIDDAKMLLESGKHNHEKPAAAEYDHARAIAKARSARGYAQAAETLANQLIK